MRVNVKLKELNQLSISEYDWTVKNRRDLIRDIYDNGYNVNKGCVRITNDFYIIDGNHRHKILTEINGGDFEIEVIKLFFNHKIYTGVVVFLSFLFLPIIILIELLKINKLKNVG
jgi:hypothetical protein